MQLAFWLEGPNLIWPTRSLVPTGASTASGGHYTRTCIHGEYWKVTGPRLLMLCGGSFAAVAEYGFALGFDSIAHFWKPSQPRDKGFL